MILCDFSSVIHRMISSATKTPNLSIKNGKYVTKEYEKLLLDYILAELINIEMKYRNEFGEMVLLFDDWKKDYWRRDVYADYKSHRGGHRDASLVDYKEVFAVVNKLVEQLENNTSWRCITVPRAEADDTILVLSREFSKREKILIYSPDKDFIQSQRDTENVCQYSPLTKKWMKSTDKYDSAEHWQLEHVMLGDSSDGVPKVVDHCEFSVNFKKHLENCDVAGVFHDVHTFKYGLKDINGIIINTVDNKRDILESFTVQKKNKSGEDIGLDIYKDVRFGTDALQKSIKKHGSLDNFLDSHPLYREHYERNFKLVMEEGIPEDIWQKTMHEYNNVPKTFNKIEFEQFLDEFGLHRIKSELNKVFDTAEPITIENCGW